MSLTVVGGLPGSGVQQVLHAALAEAVQAGRSVLLVVPTAGDAARARRALAPAAPVGVRVATLDGLVEAEWAISGDGRRPVRGLQRDVLLARALSVTEGAPSPGRGAVSLLGTIAFRAASAGERSPAAASGDAMVLVAALRAYRDLLDAHELIEPAEASRALALLAPPADVVGVDGFLELDPAQFELLTGWSNRGADVTIALPWSEGVAGTAPLDDLVARLRDHGAAVRDLRGPVDGRSEELVRVGTELFAGAPPGAGEGRVRLAIASGTEGEARLVAGLVADVIARGDDKTAVTIAVPGTRRGITWVLRAFADAGVEATLDVSVAVTETALGRALLHLWSFCRAGMDRGDLTAFLRTPFSGVSLEQADSCDVAWRRGGLAAGEGLLRRVPELRGIVSSCSGASRRGVDSETAKIWKSIADALLASAHPGPSPVPDADGLIDAAVHRAFVTSLEEAVLLGEGEVTADEIWAAFAAGSVHVADADGAGRAIVTSVDNVWRLAPANVVVTGLTASEMPRRGSDDRLEGDVVRGALSALGLTSDAEEHLRRERLAFFLAVSTPRESVALVRREADDEGRVLRESVFWDEFLDLYRKPGDLLPADGRLQVERAEPGSPETQGAVRPGQRGAVRDRHVLEELAAIESVGPGEVELYAACPYRWYVERKLRQTSPDTAVDAMAAGRAAHDALASFYREWLEQRGGRVTPETVEQAVQRAREHAEAALARGPRATTLEEKRLLASVVPAVVGVVSRDAGFLPGYRPEHLEWSFGLEGDAPVDLGGVLVKGRADRIDVGPEGLVVIDYKRTHASSLAEIRRDGLVQLQLYAAVASARLGLPIAGGLYRSLSTGDDRGFGLPEISEGLKSRDVIDAGELAATIDEAVRLAKAAVEGMRAGRIAPAPLKERCAHCAARPFCPEGVS